MSLGETSCGNFGPCLKANPVSQRQNIHGLFEGHVIFSERIFCVYFLAIGISFRHSGGTCMAAMAKHLIKVGPTPAFFVAMGFQSIDNKWSNQWQKGQYAHTIPAKKLKFSFGFWLQLHKRAFKITSNICNCPLVFIPLSTIPPPISPFHGQSFDIFLLLRSSLWGTT